MMSADVNTILHLGLGSFHRAHQAVYMQALHDKGKTDWVLAGGNIRPDMMDTIAALQTSKGRYTLETVTPQGRRRYEQINAIRQIVPFEVGLKPLLAVGAAPSTRIISFTVTEAGYYLDSNDRLDLSAADVAEDLATAKANGAGGTIYGALVAILRTRRQQGSGPVTLLNCDNLRHNGDRSRNGLLQFVEQLNDPLLAEWISQNTSSPNCMVDRITPRPHPDVQARVASATGRDDHAALMAEDFIQWVIEDRFCAGRPDWPEVGVEMVTDVAQYEEAKIRILNATHSCIAWAGTLMGYQYIHEGVAHSGIRKLAFDYVTEDVIPCLEPSPIGLTNYRDVVLERFANPAIEDTNQRVAMDGFSKIPGFIAPTIAQRLAQGQSIRAVAVLPALFLRFLHLWHSGALPYAYEDQMMDEEQAHRICQHNDPIAMFGNEAALWGSLAGDDRLVSSLRVADREVSEFMVEASA